MITKQHREIADWLINEVVRLVPGSTKHAILNHTRGTAVSPITTHCANTVCWILSQLGLSSTAVALLLKRNDGGTIRHRSSNHARIMALHPKVMQFTESLLSATIGNFGLVRRKDDQILYRALRYADLVSANPPALKQLYQRVQRLVADQQ